MPGPLIRPGFSLPEVVLRFAASACAVLWLLHLGGPVLVRPLAAPLRAVMQWLDPAFTITDIGAAARGPRLELYIRATPARPTPMRPSTASASGTPGGPGAPPEELLIAREIDNVFQYAALALIVAFAWPGTTGEMGARLLIALPLSLLLVLIDVPSEALGDLWSLLHRLHPEIAAAGSGWTIWGRLLMGGGGLALGLMVAAVAISAPIAVIKNSHPPASV